MTLQEYLTSLRHKTVAVIGIGVSNTPLLRRLLAEGIAVTACDRSSREKLGPLADELEAAGATLQLGEGYLDGLTQDVIFRTPGLRPDVPQLLAAQRQGSTLTSGDGGVLSGLPLPHDRRHRQRRQDHHHHHHRRAAEGGGQNRPRGRQHRSAPAVSGG